MRMEISAAADWSFERGDDGRGRVRSRGDAGRVLEASDVIHVGGDEWHFHGAGRDTPIVHVAVNGGGTPRWGEPVSDDDYDEGFA
jgi:hypothetical protein